MTLADDDLAADYQGAGFSGRLGFGRRPALLVIDFAMAYLDRWSPLYAGVEKTLDSACRVLDAARAAGTVTHFSLERPSLTDLFRAAVSA